MGNRIALIGGMDQHSVLTEGSAADIRAQVQLLFSTVGADGGYILSCADHFFETPLDHLDSFARAAFECVY
jgi:uroporphyrinogen decarboxylase